MQKLFTLPAQNHQATDKIARKIFEQYLRDAGNFTIFFQGTLGAGKTYFVRQLLQAFGVEGEITSTTYALVQEYEGFAHFDFYRLASPEEFFARGFSDIAEDPTVSCLVEWGEKIDKNAQSLFTGKKFIIRIEHGLGVGMRKITLFEK